MKVIAIATIKGGVGKTILSTHLAAALARNGQKTLLLDLDPQGHATALAGIDAHPEAFCVGDVLLRESRLKLDDILVRELRPNLDVAPAVLKMAAQERQLYAWALRLKTVRRALDSLERKPDVVVIDCPPHIGGFTEAALHASDLTLAPVPALAGSTQGLEDLRSTWAEMRDGRVGHLACVVNLWDQRTSVTNALVSEMLEASEVPVLDTKIPKSEVVNQAALKQSLVFDHAPTHPVAKAFDRLAQETWQLLCDHDDALDEQDGLSTSDLGQWIHEALEPSRSWAVPAEAMLAADGYSVIQD
ncbi:MAG: ParA family protein [Myxococcales bacterium]|nr:MAG: ParA family protein [Myxococcales bacterium]